MPAHKHAELIKAWADGAKIQCEYVDGRWVDKEHPYWAPQTVYRIKPEPKPDVIRYACINNGIANLHQGYSYESPHNLSGLNVKATFDGETGKLKSVELIKENS